MKLTITQEHVDKARQDAFTKSTSQSCPIWQALAALGLTHLSVGYDGAYVVRNEASKLVARIEQGTPLWDVGDWFDRPNGRREDSLPVPTFPISADIEMLA